METLSLLLAVFGVIAAILILRWLIRPSSDGFNTALDKYRELQETLPSPNADPYEIVDMAFDTIRLFQIAIKNKPRNFDSYVVLANVYYSLGIRFKDTGIFTICYRLAAATMMFWKENSGYTRNRSKGEYLWHVISKGFQELRQLGHMGRQTSLLHRVIDGDFNDSFNEAIDMQTLPITKKLAVTWLELESVVDMIDVNNRDSNLLALRKCDDIIAENPDMGPAFFSRAQVHAALGNHEQTIEDIDSFERLEGQNEYSSATLILARQALEKKEMELKENVIAQMASRNNSFALEAVGIATDKGWLYDGSLEGVKFRNANLMRADFQSANFAGADFLSAKLTGANLRGASLDGAILVLANFEEADLLNANITGAFLLRAKVAGANLAEANLTGANLQQADFAGTILWKANLEGADLAGANITGANLGGANLKGVVYDDKTRWPDGFDPKSAGAINMGELSEEEMDVWQKKYRPAQQ